MECIICFVFYQLCAVYLFEYVAQGCAAKVRPASEYNKGCPELFAALSFCYQVQVHQKTKSLRYSLDFYIVFLMVNLRYDAVFCISYYTGEFQINRITQLLYLCLSTTFLQHLFQAGVFVSRSSVQLFQIKRVDILSVLQFLNMVLWIFDVHVRINEKDLN